MKRKWSMAINKSTMQLMVMVGRQQAKWNTLHHIHTLTRTYKHTYKFIKLFCTFAWRNTKSQLCSNGIILSRSLAIVCIKAKLNLFGSSNFICTKWEATLSHVHFHSRFFILSVLIALECMRARVCKCAYKYTCVFFPPFHLTTNTESRNIVGNYNLCTYSSTDLASGWTNLTFYAS